MRSRDDKLLTPIYVKTDPELPWPENDPVFYVLSSSGLFLCRNHVFFRSCVPARTCPSELAAHSQFLQLRCPRVQQEQMEAIVGFFSRIADIHGSEAAVVLLWDRDAKRVRFRVPLQRATVTEGWTGNRYASDVRYDIPQLPENLSIIGTIHSHVDGPAYASYVDWQDETHMAGLHIVVGHIRQEPPEVHCEYVVDGVRFRVDPAAVLEGYERRQTDVPHEWIDRVRVEILRADRRDTYYDGEHEHQPVQGRLQ
jgi:proteasome lid subunit RPN8/RPN11